MTRRERTIGAGFVILLALALVVPALTAQLQQSGGPGSTVTANAGTNLNTSALALNATLTDKSQFAKITDGTRDALVKAASTLPLLTDTALVVTQRDPLPAGTNVLGHMIIDAAPTTAVTIATAPALVTSVANIGIVRAVPSACTQATPFANTTVGVATGAGTSVSSTTTCVTFAFVNNITNSAVTLRVQDKTGTPIIWLGGNADFAIPANSNMRIPLDGVTMVSGLTAIAGTASALNLQINGLQ